MSIKFKNLKNDLKDLEDEGPELGLNQSQSGSSGGNKTANYILLFAFIATLVFYAGSRVTSFISDTGNTISEVVQSFGQYDAELLAGMGEWMEEMGYGVLTDQELIELRDEGVTATETQRLHDLGYTDITLEELVDLQRADISASDIAQYQSAGYTGATIPELVQVGNAEASPTYARMMKELGYDFTMTELAETRAAGVTANFTSRMMDLGYTFEELTKENLMRMKSVGVTDGLAERLITAEGERPTIDELIRYRISNQ
jgi:hypothetical protein